METEVGCYYYFMPQKSPALTLGLGHSGGASCSGNALRGALSAHTIVSYMPFERYGLVVIPASFRMVRQGKHLVLHRRSKVTGRAMDKETV